MNNPDNIPLDETELREWLKMHKDARGLSYTALAPLIGIAKGTLSPWLTGNYNGPGDHIAKAVFKYRQLLETQAVHVENEEQAGLDRAPSFLKTPTALRLRSLMIKAQHGYITVGATAPGTSKTMTMNDYAASVANVWPVTINPTTRTMQAMVAEVLRKVSGKAPTGWVRQMSKQVEDLVRDRNGLLVFDEANHLDFEALEQARAWHDATGVGICLLGNSELLAKIKSGGTRHALARLASRIAMSHVQEMPQTGDVEEYLDGWGIRSAEQRAMLSRIALTPGSGGLREIKHIIENALMVASEDDVPLALGHLREALSMRSTSIVRV